jgi:hypothetical protein
MSNQPTYEQVTAAMADQVRQVIDAIAGSGVTIEVQEEPEVVDVTAMTLRAGDTIHGEHGGTSRVLWVETQVVVRTEHGVMYFQRDDHVAVQR